MIYLIGPYTSSSLAEHQLNIGRLYAYYLKLTKEHPGEPIVCYPLMTSGFEQVHTLHNHDWMALCKALIAWTMPDCYIAPGYERSTGSLDEIKYAEQLDLTISYLPRIAHDEALALTYDLMLLQSRNQFARLALRWLASD